MAAMRRIQIHIDEELDEAVATFEHIGEKQMVIETKAKIAENLAFQGSAPRALATAKDALAMIDPAEGTNMAAPMLQRIRGYALMQMRSLADAGEAFEQSLSLANASEIQYDVALALRASAYLARCRQTRRDDLEAKSASILARLGVASVVDPPGTMDPGQGATIELDPLRSGTSS